MRDHGTYACYVWGPEPGCLPGRGCRCDDCKAAVRAKAAADRRRTAPPYVDASRARTHAKALMAQGFGLKAQAKAAGVSATMLSKVVYDDPRRGQALTKRIRPDNERAILGLTLDDAPDSARTVTAERYAAVLDELHRRGWTYTQVADRVGCALNNLRPRRRAGQTEVKVTAGRYRAVRALLDEHPPEIGTDTNGHNAAALRRRAEFDPEAERRDKLRRAAQAEGRAHYRALARGDEPPTIDQAALAAQEWRDRAACRFVPDDERWIFWAPEADRRAMDACREVCSWCPVADDCLAEAIRSGETGFWGGHTEAERKAMQEFAA